MRNDSEMSAPPSRSWVRRLHTMVEAGLVGHKELQPWAESVLLQLAKPPRWLCDVAVKRYQPELSKALGEHAWGEPFESVDQAEIDDDHLASLFLRYQRRELSWATFLEKAGSYADAVNNQWHCEDFYDLLNKLEDADYSSTVETGQRQEIEARLSAGIGRVRAVYDALTSCRRPS